MFCFLFFWGIASDVRVDRVGSQSESKWRKQMVLRWGGDSRHQSPKRFESIDIPLFDNFEEDFVPKSVILFLTVNLKSFQTHCVLHASVAIMVWPIHTKSCPKCKKMLVIPKKIVTTWSRLNSCWSAFGWCICGALCRKVSYFFVSSYQHQRSQTKVRSGLRRFKPWLTKKEKKKKNEPIT